jgi:hypothetical protein
MTDILFAAVIALLVTIFGVLVNFVGFESRRGIVFVSVVSFVVAFALAYYAAVPELLLRFVWNISS